MKPGPKKTEETPSILFKSPEKALSDKSDIIFLHLDFFTYFLDFVGGP